MTVSINLKVFLFAVLFYFTKQIQIYALLMIFALIHEMGHLICGLLLGFKPKALKIMPLGISIEFRVENEDYNKKIKLGNILAVKKMIIALAGPITNLLIILICLITKKYFENELYIKIIYTNILIAVFNMLPIYPLDGGRILKQFIKIKKGVIDSLQYTYIIQNVLMIILTFTASIAIYYLENISILLIIMYLWILVLNENKKYSVRKRIYNCIKENT